MLPPHHERGAAPAISRPAVRITSATPEERGSDLSREPRGSAFRRAISRAPNDCATRVPRLPPQSGSVSGTPAYIRVGRIHGRLYTGRHARIHARVYPGRPSLWLTVLASEPAAERGGARPTVGRKRTGGRTSAAQPSACITRE
eukprot:6863047-Prymnesium_polylepis.1